MPKNDHISSDGIAFLQETHVAHFVTLMPDGMPQLTIVWVDVEPDGSHVLINTVEGHLKLKNVDRDPRVAVSVIDERNVAKFVIVRGRVIERRTEGADKHIDFLAKKYTGAEKYTPYGRTTEERVILRIKPDHVLERGVAKPV